MCQPVIAPENQRLYVRRITEMDKEYHMDFLEETNEIAVAYKGDLGSKKTGEN